MSSARRAAAALAVLLGTGLALASSRPAAAQFGPDECGDRALWSCAWDAGFADGMTFDGETVLLSGSFRPPFGDVARVHAVLVPAHAGPACGVAEVEHLYGEDDPTNPDGSVPFALELAPQCDDDYDVEVRAYREQFGPNADESPALELHDVRIALDRVDPAAPTSTTVTSPSEQAPAGPTPTGGPPPPTTAVAPPVVRAGGLPPNRLPAGPAGPPDGSFEETLDYSDAEFGSEAAVPPSDAESFLELDEDGPSGAGLAEPVAIGSCLAMWAFHLRYLSRRADQLA